MSIIRIGGNKEVNTKNFTTEEQCRLYEAASKEYRVKHITDTILSAFIIGLAVTLAYKTNNYAWLNLLWLILIV